MIGIRDHYLVGRVFSGQFWIGVNGAGYCSVSGPFGLAGGPSWGAPVRSWAPAPPSKRKTKQYPMLRLIYTESLRVLLERLSLRWRRAQSKALLNFENGRDAGHGISFDVTFRGDAIWAAL
jgi:hypothetical protein